MGQDAQLKETLERQHVAESLSQSLQAELAQIEAEFTERHNDVDGAITQLSNELKSITEDLAVNVKLEGDISRATVNTARQVRQGEIDLIQQGDTLKGDDLIRNHLIINII